MPRERLDKIMVDRGLAQSRERAKALVMAGGVTVNGMPALKPGALVDAEAAVALKKDDIPFVGRGGLKLDAALARFGVDPGGKTAMDIGCSTGGFTDCLLQKGADRVYAVDVGYGQFDWTLRSDPRVVLMEKTNIRHLPREAVPESVDLVVIDVSFISLEKVLPKALEFLAARGEIIALIKPQFEVGRGMVDKGGIVRDGEQHRAVTERIAAFAGSLGLTVAGIMQSPVLGQKGNREFLIHLRRES
ncbi:MAG: TlyA family rRNA (cytidine-2'-O)-methyltransferase [Thermodesulfovibrionales bacterium]